MWGRDVFFIEEKGRAWKTAMFSKKEGFKVKRGQKNTLGGKGKEKRDQIRVNLQGFKKRWAANKKNISTVLSKTNEKLVLGGK